MTSLPTPRRRSREPSQARPPATTARAPKNASTASNPTILGWYARSQNYQPVRRLGVRAPEERARGRHAPSHSLGPPAVMAQDRPSRGTGIIRELDDPRWRLL